MAGVDQGLIEQDRSVGPDERAVDKSKSIVTLTGEQVRVG